MKAFFCIAFVSLCLSSVLADETCASTSEPVETACDYPNSLTLVSSPNKNEVNSSNCDAEFTKSEWQEQPTVIYPDAKPGKTYTLINIDPDPPGYQKGQYWLHWLVSNIKGEDFARGDLSKANHLTGYYGPAPPAGSGVHRYMFLTFEESDENLVVENPKSRSKMELIPWLLRQVDLCGPVAGIQFRTQF